MDKKFYEMPEVKVIDLHVKEAILVGSSGISDDDNKSGKDDTPGGDDDF